jgi:hypothetical protein
MWHPGDRRILTTGHQLVEDALRLTARVEAELLSSLGGEQTSGLQDALTRVLNSAEKHDLHPAPFVPGLSSLPKPEASALPAA